MEQPPPARDEIVATLENVKLHPGMYGIRTDDELAAFLGGIGWFHRVAQVAVTVVDEAIEYLRATA